MMNAIQFFSVAHPSLKTYLVVSLTYVHLLLLLKLKKQLCQHEPKGGLTQGTGKSKTHFRILVFTSLFSFHLMITYIIFAHASLYVMVLQVGKICVLDLPPPPVPSLQEKCMHLYMLSTCRYFLQLQLP